MTASARAVLAAAGLAGIAACWTATLALRRVRGVPGLRIDAAWAEAVREHSPTPAVAGSRVLAALGAAPGSVVVAILIGAALRWRRGPRAALGFIAAALLVQGLVTAMKLAGQRPGPAGAVFDDRGSFPSGHTAYAAVIAVTVALVARRPWASAAALPLVPLMALSRTVVDAHWLTDTAAGALCGGSVAVLAHAATTRGPAQHVRGPS